MPRAHALMVARDPTSGAVLTSATVNVYVPGTTTFISGPIFDRSGTQLSNPLTSDAVTGLVDFYLNIAQNVDLNIVRLGFTTRTYFNVPVVDDPANNMTALLSSTGAMVYASSANTPATLPIGVANAVLQNIGSVPTWRTTLAGLTLTQPTIGDFTNSTHTHANAAGGGTVAHGSLSASGTTTHAQLDSHVAAGSGVHGVTGLVVGTSDTQSLTNKTVNSLGPSIQGSGALVGATSPTISSPTISSPTLSGTITNTGTILGGTISGTTSGPFTNDWFRNSVAGQGLMNQVTGRGGYFGPGGLIDSPNGYTYYHSNNLTVPASSIVGISDTQTLTNKTYSAPQFDATFIRSSTNIVLPAASTGRLYIVKASGAGITINASTGNTISQGTSAAAPSISINNGDSVVLFSENNVDWWVVARGS